MSKRQFAQEHECEFFGSSNTLIKGESLELMTYNDPINIDNEEQLFVYEKPVPGAVYVLTVDVGEGVGEDFSTCQVIRVDKKPFKQVACYRNNEISPWDFHNIVNKLGLEYNTAYILVENNAVGKIVADQLYIEHEYENLLSSKIVKGNEVLQEFSFHEIGLKLTKKTKGIGCTTLKTLIEEQFLVVQDWNTIQEFTTFIKHQGTYKAKAGKHDDLVTPFIAFAWLTTIPLFEDLSSSTMQEMLKRHREETADDSHECFGFFSDGTEDYLDDCA